MPHYSVIAVEFLASFIGMGTTRNFFPRESSKFYEERELENVLTNLRLSHLRLIFTD
jgi:hypothetical protein